MVSHVGCSKHLHTEECKGLNLHGMTSYRDWINILKASPLFSTHKPIKKGVHMNWRFYTTLKRELCRVGYNLCKGITAVWIHISKFSKKPNTSTPYTFIWVFTLGYKLFSCTPDKDIWDFTLWSKILLYLCYLTRDVKLRHHVNAWLLEAYF